MYSSNSSNSLSESPSNTEEYKICIMCSSNEAKYCRDCHKDLCIDCVEKEKVINFVVKKHVLCVDCNDRICCYKKICHKCDIHPYHMITENIGIGSCDSDYEGFDVIVNVNYPENEAKNSDIAVQKKFNKLIIHVGLEDMIDKENLALEFLVKIIPVIYKLYAGKKMLFHCFAGMSRSTMFATGYLAYSLNISVKEAYAMVISKRKFVEINQGFIRALEKFDKEKDSLMEIYNKK